MLALPNPSGTPRPVIAHESAIKNKFLVVLLGDNAVGKTWLLHRYVHGPIAHPITATIGASLYKKTEHLKHDSTVEFMLWDTAGNERYNSLSELFCRGAHAAVIVYDVTNEHTFEKAKFWVKRLEKVAPPGIFKALAGNKADEKSRRMVSYEDAKSYAEDNIVDMVVEVSALTGENVENLFLTLGYNLVFANTLMDDLRKTITKNRKTLDLKGRRLVRVSDIVTELTEVKVLNLSHNELTKLPTSTCKLTNLTTLNLNHNKLTHFPEIVVELINLTHLFVINNQLSSLPASMKNLENLQELDLRNNKLNRLCKVISYLKHLEKLYVEGNPLLSQEISSLKRMVRISATKMTTDIAAVIPAEILAQGDVAKQLYEEALREGFVYVYRGRVLFIGHERAGKTSLKKSLLGLPFDPKEQSTDGIEVDPSICEIELEQVQNWNSTGENRPGLCEFAEDLSKMFAEKQYHWIRSVELGSELTAEDSSQKSTTHLDVERSHDMMKTDLSVLSRETQVQAEADNTILEDGNVRLSKPDNVQKTHHSSSSSKVQVHPEADSAITKEGNASSNSAESVELMLDATSPPDDVTENANQRLQDMLLDGPDAEHADTTEESVVTVDLWDFAGQHLYYASHPVFLTSRAVYVLVHNLSKSLDAPAQPCVRQGKYDFILDDPNNETNLQNLLSWLVTVHSIKPTEEDNSDRLLPYVRPPVFIVGTHADKPYEDTETMTSKIQQGISGKEYEKHVIRPFFCIDNTRGTKSLLHRFKRLFGKRPQSQSRRAGQKSDTDIASGDEIGALQTKIMEVLRQEPYMGEKIPIKWFNFEKVVEALVAKNIFHMNLEQLQAHAKEVCFIENKNQFHTMLNFYYDLGVIVKHRNTVILKAQWLIDLFRKLITIPPFDKTDPVQSRCWSEVERTGVLSMELVDLVFSKFIQQGLVKEDILDMMEQFGLIGKFSPSPSDVKYFVPAQLNS